MYLLLQEQTNTPITSFSYGTTISSPWPLYLNTRQFHPVAIVTTYFKSWEVSVSRDVTPHNLADQVPELRSNVLLYSSRVDNGSMCSPKVRVLVYRTTRCHIPEDPNLIEKQYYYHPPNFPVSGYYSSFVFGKSRAQTWRRVRLKFFVVFPKLST